MHRFKRFFLYKFWLLIVEIILHHELVRPHHLGVAQQIIELNVRRCDLWVGSQNFGHLSFGDLMVLPLL